MNQEYPMPTGKAYDDFAERRRKLGQDARYRYAMSCKHCVEYCDSFNRWTNTDCVLDGVPAHERVRLASISEERLDICQTCKMYERRT